jgi:hypothetical protein
MAAFAGSTAAGGKKFPTIIAEIHHFLPPDYCRAIIMATLVTSHLDASSAMLMKKRRKVGIPHFFLLVLL